MLNYTKDHRLKNADEFSSVFIFRKVKISNHFKIHYKPNSLDYSRLGIIVSKKIHKRANRRNYMKRTIREIFRLTQNNWHGTDLIVRVNKAYSFNDFASVKAEFLSITGILVK